MPSTMLLHKHVDGADTIFSTMSVLLVKKPLLKWLGVIRRGSYQASAEDSRCSYELESELCPGIYHDSDYSVGKSSNEGSKDK